MQFDGRGSRKSVHLYFVCVNSWGLPQGLGRLQWNKSKFSCCLFQPFQLKDYLPLFVCFFVCLLVITNNINK